MVTIIEKHDFEPDQKETARCRICTEVQRHPNHKLIREPMIKGTATPDKTG